jgi:signal transduction histidine kinase
MSDTDLYQTEGSKRRRLLLVAWAVVSAANVVLMYLYPGKETVPFHLVWIGLSIVYGFTAWSPLGMAAVLVTVAVTTGWILIHHAGTGDIGWEETTEVPLMTAVFGVMVWHVRLRQRALARVAQLAEHDRRQAEAQQLFVRLVSHELRTPITVARGYTELIRDGGSGPRVAEDAEIVLDELGKLSRITHRLVTLMQMNATVARHPTDIDAELGRALHRWAPTANRVWSVRSAVGEAAVVPERLEAALDCLLDNAVKFTADGDRIEIIGARRPNAWTIEVLDTGAGMSPAPASPCGSHRTRRATNRPHRTAYTVRRPRKTWPPNGWVGDRPGYRTVKVTGTWCTNAPAVPVPVTVMVKEARGVDDVVRTRSVELPGVPTGFVLKVADAPAGRPVTDSVTLPAKPPTDPAETVYEAV